MQVYGIKQQFKMYFLDNLLFVFFSLLNFSFKCSFISFLWIEKIL